jgi:hypothetical protein
MALVIVEEMCSEGVKDFAVKIPIFKCLYFINFSLHHFVVVFQHLFGIQQKNPNSFTRNDISEIAKYYTNIFLPDQNVAKNQNANSQILPLHLWSLIFISLIGS